MNLLQVENLYAGYGKKQIVQDFSLKIEAGQIVGILGPNGCGKSTLIKALCKGIPYSGNVIMDGHDVRDISEKELAQICSYVPQRSGLSIDISVKDAVMMGFQPYLKLLESPSKEMHDKARKIIEKIGLKEQMADNYMELSEGQKRLCILARSFVADSKLMLMDEPDGALDFGVRNHLLQMVSQNVKNYQGGVLITLHDMNLALAYCDSIYLMKDGKLVDVMNPKEDSIKDMEEKLTKLYGEIRLIEYEESQHNRKHVIISLYH